MNNPTTDVLARAMLAVYRGDLWMTKNTPPKHKTPNYKLVTHTYVATTLFGQTIIYSASSWHAVPLRAGRKDK